MPRKKPKTSPAKRAQPTRLAPPVHHDPRFVRYEAKDVRAISTQRAYNGGRRLLREGLISNGKLRGQRLEGTFRTVASWWGPEYHRAYAVLPLAGTAFDARTVGSSCTCLEEQKPCQHSVALLLAWIERNDTITELPGIDQMLGDRSREELFAIIGKMIDTYPDLETVIALPPPVPGRSPNRATLNPGLIRSSVASALDAYNTLPMTLGGEDPSELTRILSLSVEYGNAGLWADSALILCEIGEQAIATSRDEERLADYEQVYSQCDTGLSICLSKQAELPESDQLDSEQRARIIRTIYDLWRVEGDLDYDEFGEFEPERVRYGPGAIANFATTAEKVKVDLWLHNEDISSEGMAADVADFEASLFSGNTQVSEELLAAYVGIELWDRVALTQLKLGQIEEGIATAKRHLRTVDDLALFAAELARIDAPAHLPRAISMIEDYAWEIEGRNPEDDGQIEAWLAYHYTIDGRAADGLRLADRWFTRDPNLQSWQTVRLAAALPGQPDDAWSSRLGKMESQLKAKELWYVLASVYADEGRIEDAVGALNKVLQQSARDPLRYTESELMALRYTVADAGERADPDGAIQVYREMVDGAIAGRTRDSYKQAMPSLARIKFVLERDDRGEEWQEMIRGLRQKHRNLRAFIEELNAADL